MKNLFFAKTLVGAVLLLGAAQAQAETLSCTLYVSTSAVLEHKIDLPFAQSQLNAQRYVGTCHFEDGRVADKQFVGIQRVIGDGSTGKMRGYSVYSFNDKDSITLEFDGGWGKAGFNGDYTVVDGSGEYAGAKGDGNFKGIQNTVNNNNVFEVTINLTE